jgi:hypothetical protein
MQHFDERSSVHICAISTQFAGFEGEDDGTREFLRGALERGDIDKLVDSPDGMTEVEARGKALTWLAEQGVDFLHLVDSDELYDEESIKRIYDVVAINEWVDWFRVSLKNYVLDMKTYLAEPFCPPRIFRVRPNRYSNLRPALFTADNDIGYRDKGDMDSGTVWPQTVLASQTISANWVWVPHITWQNDLRSKQKTEYQTRRWGNVCSFSWDDAQGGLIFNPVLPKPKVIHES